MFPRIDLNASSVIDDSAATGPGGDGGATLLEKTQTQLNSYAKLGLRVLVMAKKVLHPEEYEVWKEGHLEAEVRRKNKMFLN